MDFSETEDCLQDVEENACCFHESKRLLKTTQTRKKIITPRLAAVFDKLKISQRDAVHLLTAVLDSLGLNASDYIINRFSIHQQRSLIREETSQNVMKKFLENEIPLTIHWDTKLLTSITEQNEDRLAIVATAPGLEQIINMPAIPSGSGLEISSAIYDALEENSILTRTEAFVFDTTSSNTGRFKGACTLLEKAIGRDILFFGCRHHILEIVLAAVFSEANVEVSTSPDIAIFKKFKKHWPQIQQSNFVTGVSHSRIFQIIGDDSTEILNFAYKKLDESFPRCDYKEFLELIVIFLGGTPPKGIHFSKPGAVHYARWMAKAIYCLKIIIFRNQFPEMTDSEINGLIEVAGFIVKCYSQFWFDSHKANMAAFNDLTFLKKIDNYKIINQKISEKAISKLLNHLYYLNEECVGFALFDDRISYETKAKLVAKMSIGGPLNEDEQEDIPKKLYLRKEDFKNFISRDLSSILEDRFSVNTIKVFKRFNIPTDFLEEDPRFWEKNERFKKGQEIVSRLSVVNDCAERGIKLIQEYHGKITKDEEQKQHLLKVIFEYTFFYHLLY